MRLHHNKELFKDAIIATSQLKEIAEIYVEKDYWVTLALHSIFSDEVGKTCIFKGGTALAKCNRLIDRFSEDIDIVLLKQGDESSNQLKSKLKKITKIVGEHIPADEITLSQIANKIIENPPKQGYLTISNALQWRLQYGRIVRLAESIQGISKLIDKITG